MHRAVLRVYQTPSNARRAWANSSTDLHKHIRCDGGPDNVEVTKALAALQPLYGKNNVEIVTVDGSRVRGTVRSLKTTQALTTPSVKIECANGDLVKIPFPHIA